MTIPTMKRGLLVWSTLLLFTLLSWLPITVYCGSTTSTLYNICVRNGCPCPFIGTAFIVNCTDKGLPSVPDDIPDDASRLMLSFNPIRRLRAIDFVGLRLLEELRLDDSQISEIEEGTFDSIPTMQTLSLRNGKLSNIDSTMFFHLPFLKSIDLSYNLIADIQKDAFYTLHNLETINLKGNPLTCDCEMGAFKTWTNQRKSEVKILGAECANKNNISLFDVTDFGSCSGYQLFSDNLQCINCNTAKDHQLCNQQNSPGTTCGSTNINWIRGGCDARGAYSSMAPDPTSGLSEPVCYSIVSYRDNALSVQKGCVDDNTCHDLEKANNVNCFELSGNRNCTFCCLNNLCNFDNPGGRTIEIPMNVKLSLSGNVTPGLADSTSLEYRNFSTSIKDELELIIQSAVGAQGSFVVQIQSLGPSSLTVYFSVFCTTLREITEDSAIQFLNQTLQSLTRLIRLPVLSRSIVSTDGDVNVTDRCPQSRTQNDKGVFLWPPTNVGSNASTYCTSALTSQPAIIYRQCVSVSGIATWLAPNTNSCQFRLGPTTSTTTPTTTTSAQMTLTDLDRTVVTESNADSYSKELLQLSSNADNFDATDINITVSSLEKLLNLNGTYTAYQRERNIADTMSNLLDTSASSLQSAEQEYGAASRFLDTINKLTSNISVVDGNFETVGNNLGLFAIPSNGQTFNGLTLSAQSPPGEDLDSSKLTVSGDDTIPTGSTSFIKLPSDLVSQLPESERSKVSRITFTAFKNDNLFKAIGPSAQDDNTNGFVTGINSVVLAASIPGVTVQQLANPVQFKFEQEQAGKNGTCVYFVEEGLSAGQWIDDGCRVTEEVPGRYTACECDHLTNFALLMDIYGVGGGIDEANKKALTYLSYIGCGVSLLSLTLTLITYAIFRKLRSNIPSKILICLCIAIASTNLIFLVGEQDYALQNETACKVVAGLLHYFLLAAMMWMLVDAFYMYMALVRIFNTHFSRFLLKSCLFGWGIPLVIVGITIGVNTPDNYGVQAGGICWLAPIAFYAAFLTPVGIAIILNFVVFGLVLRQILGIRAKKIKKSDKRNTYKRLRNVATVVVMLGLTWAFAIFAVTSSAGGLIFQYLFTISNSLQGFFIFLFHCLLKDDARNAWRTKICGADRDVSQTSKDFKSGTDLKNRTKQTGYSSTGSKEKTEEFSDITKSVSEDKGNGAFSAGKPSDISNEKRKLEAYPSYSSSTT